MARSMFSIREQRLASGWSHRSSGGFAECAPGILIHFHGSPPHSGQGPVSSECTTENKRRHNTGRRRQNRILRSQYKQRKAVLEIQDVEWFNSNTAKKRSTSTLIFDQETVYILMDLCRMYPYL